MDRKTYYVSPLTWILPIFLFLLAAISTVCFAIIALSIPTVENPLMMLLICLCILILMCFIWYAALIFFEIPKTRLELSEAGLIFYGQGYRIYTPWQNISAVGWTRLSRTLPGLFLLKQPASMGALSFDEGILSRQAVIEKRCWWLLNSDIRAGKYKYVIRVPILIMRRKDKQEGLMRQYLQYYLPHLVAPQGTEVLYPNNSTVPVRVLIMPVLLLLVAWLIERIWHISLGHTYFTFLAIWLLFELRNVIRNVAKYIARSLPRNEQ